MSVFDTPHENRDASQGPDDTPVWIWQRVWELEKMLDIYRDLNPRTVLEIGTYTGGTLFHFLRNTRAPATVVSLDLYETWTWDPAHGGDGRHLYDGWTPSGVTLEVWEGRSQHPSIVERARQLAPFDFVFIDGDHVEESVRADWWVYHQFVRPGGIVALHDILPSSIPNIGVAPVWRAIQRAGFKTRELVADPAADWGGIGVVYV